jgi:hypothetical protein
MTDTQLSRFKQIPVFIREKSADELARHLYNFPSLQKETVVEKFYVGRWVRWKGTVRSINTISENTISVILWELSEIGKPYLLVHLEFNTSS